MVHYSFLTPSLIRGWWKEVMTRFDGKLIIGCPSELPKAIDEAATARLMKPSEYVRRAIIDRLVADGIAIKPRSAGVAV